MAVDWSTIHIGAAYFEDGSGGDEVGDAIGVTFIGGAPGTQLTELSFDTDKFYDGFSMGDVFFDTQPGGRGSYGTTELTILEQTGFDIISAAVEDGGMTLTFQFDGFEAGEKLIFTIDVDEQGSNSSNAVAEGNEFETTHMSAVFEADHFVRAGGTGDFFDIYDLKAKAAELDLPSDNERPPQVDSSLDDEDVPVYSAAAIFAVEQTPLPITIAGSVFEDLDLDNTKDPGEPGLADVALSLWLLEEATYGDTGKMVTTDASGNYLFEDVQPGTYQIRETQPGGYFSVGAKAGTVNGATRGTVVNVDVIGGMAMLGGEDSVGNDFGEVRPASLNGNVYHDADNDGRFDPGETGIGNVTVEVQRFLPGQVNPVETTPTQTAPDGSWSIEALYPGQYRVVEQQPGGYLDGLDAAGTAGGTAQNPGDRIDGIHLGSGQAGQEYNFGELLSANIGGHVYVDLNTNGIFDSGETPLQYVTVHLLDSSGNTLQSTQTNAAGGYGFYNLDPGTYGLHEDQPDDYFDGLEHIGSAGGSLLATDSIIDIVLPSGAEATDYDFGEIPPGSLSGRVFVDSNGNGTYQQGETLLADVFVHLLDGSGQTLQSTKTNASGEYAFTRLPPGLYGLHEEQPTFYFDGPEHVGSVGGSLLATDSIIDIELPAGVDGIHYDFAEIPPASLSGYVYADLSNDGQFDSGEVGIGGVDIALLGIGGFVEGQATTDASGFYRFDHLRPGTYNVVEDQPAEYYDGLDTAGSVGGKAHNPDDDRITDVWLKAGVVATDYNFGELPPATIQGRVHAELNGDCTPDPGEPLLQGVTVYLLDAAGNRIRKTETDVNGEYSFGNIEPGTYGLEEIQPPDYLDGRDHVGSANGRLDGNDRMADIPLGPGVDAIDYNFCEMVPAKISGYVYQDGPTILVEEGEPVPELHTIRDGRLTADDTRLSGVLLRLGDASGAPLEKDYAVRTNAAGYYEFTMLEPDTYTVIEIHPEGYIDGIDTPGSKGGVAINPHDDIEPYLQTLAVDPKNDAIIRIPITMGDVAVSYNFSEVLIGELPPLIPPPTPTPNPWPNLKPPTAAPFATTPPPVVLPFESASILATTLREGSDSSPYYTWHLSIIDAGHPRRDRPDSDTRGQFTSAHFDLAYWLDTDLDRALWVIDGAEDTSTLGQPGALPVTGDFNGDGFDEIAVYIDGNWFIDLNGNGVWDADDLWAKLGDEDDRPVAGDWDGDGKTDIGVYGPAWVGDLRAIAVEPGVPDPDNEHTGQLKNIPPEREYAASELRVMQRSAQGKFRTDLIDHVFDYEFRGGQPIAGDFNGDGIATIGVFQEGLWLIDADGDGKDSDGDLKFELGEAGDIAVVGDFNGDGIDDPGVYRAGKWLLDTDGNRRHDASDEVFDKLGDDGDLPAVGDFNGDGTDQRAVFQDDAPTPRQQASQ